MIYLFDRIESFSDELFWRSIKVIPAERVAKALTFKHMIDRKLSIIAYLLLVYGIKKEYGILGNLEFGFGKNEKPYLKKYPEIFFNISHCKQGVVCAISQEEVGIDIEEVIPYEEEVAKYICNESEYKSLSCSKQQALDFCTLWTQKESVLKFTKQGICEELKNVLTNNEEVEIVTVCSAKQHYVLSVCEKTKIRN